MAITPTTDPYDVSDQVSEFKSAYYGEDVRDGIIDLANKLNNELNDLANTAFVGVDASLTQAGQGADAKATGDAIDGIYDHFDNYVPISGYNTTISNIQNGKMNKDNPTGTGKLSINRMAGTTSGSYSAAVGEGCVASPEASIALGHTAEVSPSAGVGNVAIGDHVVADSHSHFVIGKYNKRNTSEDRLFVVGNGSSVSASNAMTVDINGNMWVPGDIKVGGSSSADGDKLATEDFVTDAIDDIPLDIIPTQNNTDRAVSSGGVYAKLQQAVTDANAYTRTYIDGRTDAEPTEDSTKLVTSGGVYDALADKLDETDPVIKGQLTLDSQGGAALGKFCTTDGRGSVAIGFDVNATGAGQLATGVFNVSDANQLFIIGNGTSSDSRSNAMTVDANGNVWASGDVRVRGDSYSIGSKKLAAEASGTFTKGASGDSTVIVRQIGSMVMIQGIYQPNSGTIGSGKIGTISGVNIPSSAAQGALVLPCVTTDSAFQNPHVGCIITNPVNDTLDLYLRGTQTDAIVIINACFFV